jgi:hypothetical protein
MPCAGHSVWHGNTAGEANPDVFVLRAVESNGAILKEQETRHHDGAAFDAVLSLLPLESR